MFDRHDRPPPPSPLRELAALVAAETPAVTVAALRGADRVAGALADVLARASIRLGSAGAAAHAASIRLAAADGAPLAPVIPLRDAARDEADVAAALAEAMRRHPSAGRDVAP